MEYILLALKLYLLTGILVTLYDVHRGHTLGFYSITRTKLGWIGIALAILFSILAWQYPLKFHIDSWRSKLNVNNYN